MVYFQAGSAETELTNKQIEEGLLTALEQLGPKKRVLALPPDFTRFHSYAGPITEMADRYYGQSLTTVLPALGTHFAMTTDEINKMFGSIRHDKFKVHDWRNDVLTVGEVPAEYIRQVSENKVDYSWPAQVNSLLTEGNYDLILSVGQVVPHEVVGMANYNKNIFVGTGGAEGINKSHFIGAVYGMERMMGRADTPVRRVLNYASEHFTAHLPIVYVQTVLSRNQEGRLVVRGLFIGDDFECFRLASELSLKVNFQMLDQPLKKVVVYLDPSEFKSTWLGNKSIYRSRMAIADGGELIVLAPGLREFGEDPQIDALIRKYGYVGTPKVLQLCAENEDLRNNLSAAAHLIHGSGEGRFSITYCPGHLSRAEVEKANFEYADLASMVQRYNPETLHEGWNSVGGEDIFFISNPALGLWASRDRFEKS